MQTMTESQQNSPSNEAVDSFLSEYKELTEKHKIDFASFPVFIPDGSGGFRVVVQSVPVSIENQPVKSPFIPKT